MTKSKWTDDDIERLLTLIAHDQRDQDFDDFPEAEYFAPWTAEDEAAADSFMAKLAAREAEQNHLGPVVRRLRGSSSIEEFAAHFGLSAVDVLTLEAAAVPLEPRDEATAISAAELTSVQPLKILRLLRAMRARERSRHLDVESPPLLIAARKPPRKRDDDA